MGKHSLCRATVYKTDPGSCLGAGVSACRVASHTHQHPFPAQRAECEKCQWSPATNRLFPSLISMSHMYPPTGNESPLSEPQHSVFGKFFLFLYHQALSLHNVYSSVLFGTTVSNFNLRCYDLNQRIFTKLLIYIIGVYLYLIPYCKHHTENRQKNIIFGKGKIFQEGISVGFGK